MTDVLSGKLPASIMEEKTLPIAVRKRKHVGVGPYIPKPPPKKSSGSKQLRESLELLISECLEKEVHQECWMQLLRNEVDNIFVMLKKMMKKQGKRFFLNTKKLNVFGNVSCAM